MRNVASIAGVLFATLLTAPALAAPPEAAKPGKPEPLPAPEARLWIIAPSPTGLWTLRLDNAGTRPIRVPADVRLLSFKVEPNEGVTVDAKGRAKPKKAVKPITCAVPRAMRPDGFPERNAMLLAPGESYVETFDPRLFCFGKDAAALAGASVVQPHFGWDPPAKNSKAPPSPPFAVEGTDHPAVVAPQRELTAPTLVLSYERPAAEAAPAEAPKAEAPKSDAPAEAPKADAPKDAKPPIVDQNAPRLELTVEPWLDASEPSRIPITVTVINAGHRPTLAVLRPRMLAFRVEGPDGAARCDASPPADAIPREMFRTLKPGEKTQLTVLLGEVCPNSAFRRPGLYRVTPTLVLNESGAALGLQAYTGVAPAKEPALIRLQTAPEPFYAKVPRPVSTPRSAPPAEE